MAVDRPYAPLPPLAVLLLHLGACREAIKWAGRRSINAASLRACPDREWREWIAARCRVKVNAPWALWRRSILTVLSGYGDGDGSGYGDGYGDGSGYGEY